MSKSTFEISQELYELQQKIEDYLIQSEGEIDEQAEQLLSQFEEAKEQIDQKIYALRYVNKRLEEEKSVANGGLEYHKRKIDNYKKTITARDNAQERLKLLAKRLLAFTNGSCKVEGQSVFIRRFYSVEVESLALALAESIEHRFKGEVILRMSIDDLTPELLDKVTGFTLDSQSKEAVKEMYKNGIKLNGFVVNEKESVINL